MVGGEGFASVAACGRGLTRRVASVASPAGATGAPGAEPPDDPSGLPIVRCCPQGVGYLVGVLLVAIFEGELVLVEEVDGVLVDRFSGRVLDATEIVLLGLEVGGVLEPAA